MGISSLMSLNIYSWFLLPQPLSRHPSPPISLRCTAVNLFFQARNWGVTHLSLPPNHQVLGMLLKCICCPPHRLPKSDRVIASVTTKASELAALLPLSLHSVQHFGPREISTSTCHVISPPFPVSDHLLLLDEFPTPSMAHGETAPSGAQTWLEVPQHC